MFLTEALVAAVNGTEARFRQFALAGQIDVPSSTAG